MTLKMTKSNEVMEFFTIKTSGISLNELTTLVMSYANDDKDLTPMLKWSYSKLMSKAKWLIEDGGMRILENDLADSTNFNDWDNSFAKMKKHLQRSSKNNYLGKTKTQILEEKQINQDINNYMKGGK